VDIELRACLPQIMRILLNLECVSKVLIMSKFCYFIESSDETGGEDGQHQAGEQLQEEAVEPHVQREHRHVDNL
jgi:hypothetical protein